MTDQALSRRVLAFADDSFILGHRNSEWSGHAPILEEDIAFSNLALDELGHGHLWYELYQELGGAEPDRVVFFRNATDWRSIRLFEFPKGDWAYSMLRQYLYDAYENVLLPHLVTSSEKRVADIAAKIRSEEVYHLRHTTNWVKRLGLGTEESHARMQRALDEQWGFALELFVPLEEEGELDAAKVVPDPSIVQQEWLENVVAFLTGSGLTVPALRAVVGASRAEHTPFLAELLTDMQQVARSEEFGAEW